MGFTLPDIVIESVIRDGLESLKSKPEIIDDIFNTLKLPYAERKYGQQAIDDIKTWISSNEDGIAVVHSMLAAPGRAPCYSIQLGSDVEDRRSSHLGDDIDTIEIPLTGDDLLPFQKITNLIPTSYDPATGVLSIDDSVDLSKVYNGYLYVDGSGVEFEIFAISETPGMKFVVIAKNATPDVANAGLIKSPIDSERFEVKGIFSDVQLLLGVHTKDALTTKYLYILLKYFILGRKKSLIARGFEVATISGSDFTRDLRYEGDVVYTRFLTVSGKIEDSWSSNQIPDIDSTDLDLGFCDNED